MLDIKERICLIKKLLQDDTEQSLTYAALECRLTLEYLCYERFKICHSYLSSDDLKNWQPKHVIKQISEEIDHNITKEFTLSISSQTINGRAPSTEEEYNSLEYVLVGRQAELNINKLHNLWHGLASVALHLPVPTITSGELKIYGDKEKVRKKVLATIDYLSKIDGNILTGGPTGEVFSFDCFSCGKPIKKPINSLKSKKLVNCIEPSCAESYLIEPTADNYKITQCIIRLTCESCKTDIDIPRNIFKNLHFNQELKITCTSCSESFLIIMHPCKKNQISEQVNKNRSKMELNQGNSISNAMK